MIYYHVTIQQNMYSIREHGILTSKARTVTKAVYLVTKSQLPWAVKHVQMRYNVRRAAIIIIAVSIPRRWLLNATMANFRGHRGIWQCKRDIEPGQIVQIFPPAFVPSFTPTFLSP